MAEINDFKYRSERYYNSKFIYLSDDLYEKFLKFINNRKSCINNFNSFNELINLYENKVKISDIGSFSSYSFIVDYENIRCQLIKENITIKKGSKIIFDSKFFKYDVYEVDKFYNELLNSILRIKAVQRKSNYQNQWYNRNYNRFEDFFKEKFYGYNQRYGRWSQSYENNDQYRRWTYENTPHKPKVELTSEQKKLKKLEEVYRRYTDQLNKEKSEGKDTFQTENEMAVVMKKINKLKNKINEK